MNQTIGDFFSELT